jgi:drug/metabolite transporter (DMT)-like permease
VFAALNHLRTILLPFSPNLRGSLLMALAMASFSVTDAITKFLTLQMNFGEVMLLRGLFAGILIGALVLQRRALRPLRVMVVAPVVMRIGGEIGGTILFLAAITNLPLANVSAIIQAQPLAVTLAAVLILGERVGWRRWLAIAAGFAGVLIIVRPGVDGFNLFALLALISVAFYALRDLATKQIPAEIPALLVTFLTTVVIAMVGAVVMVPLGGWVTPSGPAVGLLAVAAVLLLVGYQCIILALRAGDISAVAPFRYTQLLWAMLFGYLVFAEVPDHAMVLGASVIVLSGIYAFHRERVRNRPLATTASASDAL